jgi:hypothetical protein
MASKRLIPGPRGVQRGLQPQSEKLEHINYGEEGIEKDEKTSLRSRMFEGLFKVWSFLAQARKQVKKASRRYRPTTAKEIAERPTDNSCFRGRSSTLKKTAKLYRNARAAFEPEHEAKIHIHPRRKRRMA